MTPQVVNVSPSVLADVISCETKAWLKHVKGYTSSGDAIKAVAGQGIHAAVAAYLEPNSATPNHLADAALAAFHSIYDPAYARLAADKLEPSLVPSNLHRVLARWIEMHPPHMLPWKRVLMVEEAFVSREFSIVDPTDKRIVTDPRRITVRLIVRPDLVVEDHFGKIRFVDTKTTGWRIGDESWQKALKLSLQVQLYADAVVQKFGDAAVFGGWINAIELRELPGKPDATPKLKKDGTPAKEKLCGAHGKPYAECGHEHAKAEFIECMTTPERVQRAVLDAQAAAADFVRMLAEGVNIESLNMKGGANGTCRFCPAGNWCLSSRPVDAIANWNDFVYEPWIVDEGKR